MKILELHLRNIASIVKADIDFEKDTGMIDPDTGQAARMFLIFGDTGTGKSVLLDGIAMALFGKTPRTEGVVNRARNTFVSDSGNEINITSIEQYTRLGITEKDECYSEVVFAGNDGVDYRAKMAEFGEDEEAAQKYFDEVVEKFNAYQKETAKANLDNIVGLMAISEIMDDDTEELKALLDGLSDEMKARPEVARMIASFETLAKTGEGQPFVDFTVVQEPAVPEASTVKFSDYVGNGKFVLVDFWASWCGPCREEMPNLKNVYETYAGPNFDMLSVAVADELSETRKAAEELGITWNQIVNAQQIPLEIYGIDAIPHVILFGPDGTILKRNLRGAAIGEAVKEALGL